jgi:hypothetical protein
MNALIVTLVVLAVVALIGLSMSVKVVTQYQRGVLFRLGKVVGVKEPGLALIIPVIDRLVRVSLRIVTMPIQSQGIITRDNVSVDISAVAYFRVVDPVKSVIAIENVDSAINQIAQTTLRKVVGQHTLDEALSETDVINANIQRILDVATLEWGVEVNLVELKDIQLPDSMKRAMARPWGCVGHDDGPPARLATAEFADAGRARSGEEHHGGVPCADDERDRRNQQLPHPGNRCGEGHHTPAGPGGTIRIAGDRGGGQRQACDITTRSVCAGPGRGARLRRQFVEPHQPTCGVRLGSSPAGG